MADDVPGARPGPPGALPGAPGAPGLRERKRLAAMTRIQDRALELFEERGFDGVTVEEIAAASDVSPSSVYRWFGTKEELVLWDEFDPEIDRHLGPALAEEVPLAGLRRVVVGVVEGLTADREHQVRRRAALMMSTPELEQAASARTYEMAEHIGRAMAQRLGRPLEDLEVQVFSHAFTGGILGMLHHWHGTGFAEPLDAVVRRVFDIFEEGLDVVRAGGSAAR